MYETCVSHCAKKHAGFHPIAQQRCITECLNVPVTTGIIPFVPVKEREYYIKSQPTPEVVTETVDKVKEATEGIDINKILLAVGVIGAGYIVLNAVSKGIGEGIAKKI